MTIDTGVSVLLSLQVLAARLHTLLASVHEPVIMAISAFSRIGLLHAFPDLAGQIEAFGEKLFPRIDGATDGMKEFVSRPHLAHQHRRPFIGDVAIGAGRPHPGAIRVVHRFFVFQVHVVPHFMTRDAECLLISEFHRRVKTTPADNTEQERPGQAQ